EAEKRGGGVQLVGGEADNGTLPTTTSIPVPAATGTELKPPPPPVKPPQASASATVDASAPIVTSAGDTSTVEKSAIYRINADNTVETLWSSKEENVYDILPAPDGLYFGTDVNGRIYQLTADRKLTLLTQTNESEVIRLLQGRGAILAATGNTGKIYRLGPPASKGTYESPVFDAGGVARWGRLRWQGGGAVTMRTRSGNGNHPDATWSD